MKKMFMRCATLCFALCLFCVCALAADLEVQVSPVNGSAVQVEKKAGSAEPIFTVTQSAGAQSGQLYLVMIQQGTDASAKPLPTKENLYYLNVEEAAGTSFTTEAYPRDMAEGSYIVYLSDYSGSNQGKAQGVATIKVSAKAAQNVIPGDLDKSGIVDTDDIGLIVNIVVSERACTDYELSVGDMDDDNDIDSDDVGLLLNKYLNSLYA